MDMQARPGQCAGACYHSSSIQVAAPHAPTTSPHQRQKKLDVVARLQREARQVAQLGLHWQKAWRFKSRKRTFICFCGPVQSVRGALWQVGVRSTPTLLLAIAGPLGSVQPALKEETSTWSMLPRATTSCTARTTGRLSCSCSALYAALRCCHSASSASGPRPAEKGAWQRVCFGE